MGVLRSEGPAGLLDRFSAGPLYLYPSVGFGVSVHRTSTLASSTV
jgi:hypothetical protein